MTAIALILALLALLGWSLHARMLRRALHRAWTEQDAAEADRDRISQELDAAHLAGATLTVQLANALREQHRIEDEYETKIDEICAAFDDALARAREARERAFGDRDAHSERCVELAEQVSDLEQQNVALTERQQTHLRMIANLSQSTPLAEELQGWEGQRAALIAEIGTLRAKLVEAERRVPRETSATIARWQDETFGPATTSKDRFYRSWAAMDRAWAAVRDMDWDPAICRPNLSRAIRAAEELAELIEWLVKDDSAAKAPWEVADIDIVLRGIDAAFGVERSDMVDAKMAKNRARLWHTTGDGHGQHIETAEEGVQ